MLGAPAQQAPAPQLQGSKCAHAHSSELQGCAVIDAFGKAGAYVKCSCAPGASVVQQRSQLR
jgi:hypothetical protein